MMGKHFSGMVLACALTVASGPAFGASDQDAVAAGKMIAGLWSKLPQYSYLIHECDEGTFSLTRIRVSDVTFDVRKTNSLISPYSIVIEFDLQSDTNEPKGTSGRLLPSEMLTRKQICYKSIDEARRFLDDRFFSDVFGGPARFSHTRIVYSFSDDGYAIGSVIPLEAAAVISSQMRSPRNAAWGKFLAGGP